LVVQHIGPHSLPTLASLTGTQHHLCPGPLSVKGLHDLLRLHPRGTRASQGDTFTHLPHGRVECAPDGSQRPAGWVPCRLLQAGIPTEALTAHKVGTHETPQAGHQSEAHGSHPGWCHGCCVCCSKSSEREHRPDKCTSRDPAGQSTGSFCITQVPSPSAVS
jgi:hypothetical protein